MKPISFYAPLSRRALFQLLEESKGQVLAGGTDIIPRMRKGLSENTHLIDLSKISDLNFIEKDRTELRIGALTTHGELKDHPAVKTYFPALADAAGSVGSVQTRNRGTIGGNIANASPAADTIPALMIYDAKLILESAAGHRTTPLSDFLKGPGKTDLKPNEIISTIVIPLPSEKSRSSFLKLGKRKAMAISVINTATILELSGSNQIESVKLAMGSVSPTVVQSPAVERFLTGKTANEKIFEQAAQLILNDISPIADVRAGAGYRKEAAVSLVYKVLKDAFEKKGPNEIFNCCV